jgi:phage shock protein PspC (stress-responsive transcriptional regulator)
VDIFLGILSVLSLFPGHLGSGDSVQARDTVSVVTSVTPGLPSGVKVKIVGGDALFHLQSKNHEVMVPGYQDEPYIKITNDNKVFVNDGSTTAFLNGNRYGNVDVSQFKESDTPQWRLIGTNGTAMWHDHRVHWMSPKQPAAIDMQGTVLDWKVPFTVDGAKIEVAGTLFLRDKASVLWWLSGVLILCLAIVLSLARRSVLFGLLFTISVAGVVGGIAQYLGLPNGARVTPLLLMFSSGATVLSAAGLWAGRRRDAPQHTALSLHAGAGTALVICAWLCASQVRAAYVPGIEPMWIARVLIPTLLGVGIVATIDCVSRVVRGTD